MGQTVKCVTQEVEDKLANTIIAELKKNGFTYGNFEDVVSKVKTFYKNNATT